MLLQTPNAWQDLRSSIKATRMKLAIGLVLATLLVFTSGCASSQKESHLDRLWKQGYGFNNPNPERIRNGQRPLKFRESEKLATSEPSIGHATTLPNSH